ncbi:TetR/AcrR family transcriptional regulator [Clostridium boliviensis]|uniref:TetR/AcrR family transcriptional regulator n=1 Tax=Clostridium boliviensis TaxID=318465 RepID=A0ABU4GER7_9CLOT|nr:TetR/AcrR family transcriptional regulator [Clostridium boliviensis]MDW2796114.1 TetR/AcrR family transcriptional regulator [Clostridium boliviensis]
MESNKETRQPKQTRSKKTKEKIRNVAYQLFCEKGYFKTTTNEIARVAEVSIGSLYFYYRDKDMILVEILDRYNEAFLKVHESMNLELESYRVNPRLWLTKFMEEMIKSHRDSKEFNKELKILSYSMPEVNAVMEKQQETIRHMTLDYLKAFHDMLRVKDLEAAAIVADNLISSLVDQIVFQDNPVDDSRIISEGVDAVYQYLIGKDSM